MGTGGTANRANIAVTVLLVTLPSLRVAILRVDLVPKGQVVPFTSFLIDIPQQPSCWQCHTRTIVIAVIPFGDVLKANHIATPGASPH